MTKSYVLGSSRLRRYGPGIGCFFSVYYSSNLIKLDGDMRAISMGDRSELPEVIKAVIEAVRARELDLAVQDVAAKDIPDISVGRPFKKLR